MSDKDENLRERAEVAEQRAQVSEQRADVSENRADAAEKRADISEKRADGQEVRIQAASVVVEASEITLLQALTDASSEVATLRETLQTLYLSKDELEERFADRREVSRRRRFSLICLGFVLFSFIQAADLHIEECGPGARTEQLVEVFLDEPLPANTLAQRMRDAVDPPPPLCDVSFPTHEHGRDDGTGRAVGFAVYGAAILAAVAWYRKA